jgi:hypothetical protein
MSWSRTWVASKPAALSCSATLGERFALRAAPRGRGHGEFALLDCGCGELKGGQNVVPVEVRIVVEDLLDGAACGELAKHRGNGDSRVANGRQPAHPGRISRDPLAPHDHILSRGASRKASDRVGYLWVATSRGTGSPEGADQLHHRRCLGALSSASQCGMTRMTVDGSDRFGTLAHRLDPVTLAKLDGQAPRQSGARAIPRPSSPVARSRTPQNRLKGRVRTAQTGPRTARACPGGGT